MTADNKIILIGGGGHARVLIDLILMSDKFGIAGILDSELKKGKMVLNIPVLGSDNLLADLYGKGIRNACIAVGSIKDNSKRKMLYEKVKQVGFDMPYLIHPQAVVSKERYKNFQRCPDNGRRCYPARCFNRGKYHNKYRSDS